MIFRIALKYAFSKTKGQREASVWIILGIAVSLAALLIISSVVNGLQTQQLDKMRNVESFDIIVKGKIDSEKLTNLDLVSAIYKFADDIVLISNSDNTYRTTRIRGIEPELLKDERFSSNIVASSSEFSDGKILVPQSVIPYGYKSKQKIELTFFNKGKVSKITPKKVSFSDYSTYFSDYSSFSDNTVLISLENFSKYSDKTESYGIYTNGNLKKALSDIRLLYPDCEITTYKEYNKSFYSALMLEKLIINIFICFVIVIICANLKKSTSRLILLKKNETYILEVLGMNVKKSESVFIIQGLIISLTGILLGNFLGVLLVKNINKVLSIIDYLTYALTAVDSFLSYAVFNSSISVNELIIYDVLIIILSLLFTISSIKKDYSKGVKNVSC